VDPQVAEFEEYGPHVSETLASRRSRRKRAK
jgi:hypothetical protein